MLLSSPALYAVTVLIWGTTWIALKLQLGPVPITWSIAWRFLLAAAVLMVLLAWRGDLRRPARGAWPLLAAQGLCLFCLNFVCFLEASRWMASGLSAVCFSTSPLLNALNARLFLGQPLKPRVLAGAALGLAGLLLLFGPGLWTAAAAAADGALLRGLALAMVGTWCFSIGNLLSGALQRQGLTPLQTNPWAMLAGAVAVVGLAALRGETPAFDLSPTYVGAWLFLAIPGSVIAFTSYLTLVGRLGADKAAYCTVLFPIVALNVSAWLEDYRWTPAALAGLLLVAAGNVVVFWRRPARYPARAG